jgi:hypothetical protein
MYIYIYVPRRTEVKGSKLCDYHADADLLMLAHAVARPMKDVLICLD